MVILGKEYTITVDYRYKSILYLEKSKDMRVLTSINDNEQIVFHFSSGILKMKCWEKSKDIFRKAITHLQHEKISQPIIILDVQSSETENAVQTVKRIASMSVRECLKEEAKRYKQIMEDIFSEVSHPCNSKDKFWFESVQLIDALGGATEGQIVVNTAPPVPQQPKTSIIYFVDKSGVLQFTINEKNISDVS